MCLAKEKDQSLTPFLFNEESEGSITGLDKHPLSSDLFVSSDYDGVVTFYKLHPDYMSDVVVPGQVQPAKKVKQSNPLRQLENLSRNRLSDQAIT